MRVVDAHTYTREDRWKKSMLIVETIECIDEEKRKTNQLRSTIRARAHTLFTGRRRCQRTRKEILLVSSMETNNN